MPASWSRAHRPRGRPRPPSPGHRRPHPTAGRHRAHRGGGAGLLPLARLHPAQGRARQPRSPPSGRPRRAGPGPGPGRARRRGPSRGADGRTIGAGAGAVAAPPRPGPRAGRRRPPGPDRGGSPRRVQPLREARPTPPRRWSAPRPPVDGAVHIDGAATQTRNPTARPGPVVVAGDGTERVGRGRRGRSGWATPRSRCAIPTDRSPRPMGHRHHQLEALSSSERPDARAGRRPEQTWSGTLRGMRDWLVAGAVIEDPDRVLLVENRRRNGSTDWSPPGGVIDPARPSSRAWPARCARKPASSSTTGPT